MAWRSPHPDWVRWRLEHPEHPSLCHVCPYNGQRKVGADGPFDAFAMYLFESPGGDEEKHNLRTEEYGRPLVGASGYLSKIRYFPPEAVDIVTNPRNPKWPIVRKLKVFIANVIMCKPEKNDIDSKNGKKAVKCCSPSAKALLEHFMQENPQSGVQAVGGVAASLVAGHKVGINDQRGRVFEVRPVKYESETDIYKYVLRGVKPPDWWKPNEKVIRQILGWNRRSWKKATAPPKPVKEKKCAQLVGTASSAAIRVRRKRTRVGASGVSTRPVPSSTSSDGGSTE